MESSLGRLRVRTGDPGFAQLLSFSVIVLTPAATLGLNENSSWFYNKAKTQSENAQKILYRIKRALSRSNREMRIIEMGL